MNDVLIQVVRAGEILEMSTRQLLVGDVVLLEAGDKIPADGVLTQGDDVTVNESSLTGEAEDVRKTTASAQRGPGTDVFMLSGCTLTSGRARMLVIAVGAESRWGRIKVSMSLRSCMNTECPILREPRDGFWLWDESLHSFIIFGTGIKIMWLSR